MVDKRQQHLKTGAKVGLTVLLLNVAGQLIAVYQTRYQLISPLIAESVIWEINKQFIFQAIVSAIAGLAGLLLYFFEKYLFVVVLTVVVLIAARFIYV